MYSPNMSLINNEENANNRKKLERAAKISPQVYSVTIGPNSSFRKYEKEKSTPIVTTQRKASKEDEKPRTAPATKSLITSNDLQVLQEKMYQQSDDKRVKEEVRKKMEARIVAENLFYQKIQVGIERMKAEAEQRHKAKIEALEKKIEAALKLDEQDENIYQHNRQELTKNTRKILEQQEKEIRENLKKLDDNFGRLEDSFEKITRLCKPEMKAIVDHYKTQFGDVKSHKNACSSSIDGLKSANNKAEEICQALVKSVKEYEVNAQRAQKEADEKQVAAAQAHAQAEVEAAQAQAQAEAVKQQQAATVPQSVISEVPQTIIQSETGRQFNELMTLLNIKQNATKQLTELQELQALRFALKWAVNNPINLLNEENKMTLIEGYQKLYSLLSGQRVSTSKGEVSITDHVEAPDWTSQRIAEKLIDACDKKSATTFYIAALTVALWQKFPEFGKVFSAKLFKECPFLLPYKPEKQIGQSKEEFFKSWGYRINEREEHYEQRTARYATLMAAIWVTYPRRGEPAAHPFGVDYGWKYLVNVLNSQPDPMYLHVLDRILEVAGSTLHLTYGKQFVKLMMVMRDQYLPLIGRTIDDSTKGALDRLVVTVTKFFSENRFSQPKGKLIVNYW